ncbi:hypothetical protein [Galbibacter pacificus]|uniref:Uncharacterized protein n=1 Tax=Galbibacter pacificus TaxID=2996052 RepID=A0ABT6FM46_9FLAO|nr:hypothetical protein [Galbibacter pacificus]MDG3580858.1 hypothetical protein [Galbibacter pacificus]MDG3584336.1 hypothetical protein [Galbibacter pacificus]
MKKLLFLGLVFMSISILAQENVNNYKYIIVPKKFDFLKEANKYRVNTYTKFMFEKAGFNAIYDDQKPADLLANPCLGLKANVLDNSNLFTTKMNVTLENCQGAIIYTSDEGKSKIKEYEGAYQEALENAFVSIKGLNYNYQPVENTQVYVPSQTNTVPATTAAVAVTANTAANQATNVTPQTTAPATATSVETNSNTLFAQPINNGYQLVDTTPKVVFKITKTTQPNYYIIQDKNGFLYQKDGKWIAEYYEGDELKKQELQIKF